MTTTPTVTLTPATRDKMARLFEAFPRLPNEPARFHISGAGDYRRATGYPWCSINTAIGTPVALSRRFGPNTAEAAALLAAVEVHWATLATPEAIVAAEAAHRQQQAAQQQAVTERGQATIEEVARLIWRSMRDDTTPSIDHENRIFAVQSIRQRYDDVAGAVIMWAARVDRATLATAAQVASQPEGEQP